MYNLHETLTHQATGKRECDLQTDDKSEAVDVEVRSSVRYTRDSTTGHTRVRILLDTKAEDSLDREREPSSDREVA